MTLMQSWMDSLQLLKPKNLQLFVMVTLKSVLEAYKLMFKYFWWLIAIMIFLIFFAPNYHVASNIGNTKDLVLYAQIKGIIYLLYTLLFLAVCFITRPSIAKKDCKYFCMQYRKIALFWLFWTILFTISSVKRLFMSLFIVSGYSMVYVFIVLFLADSEGGFKSLFVSIWNALKMLVYNYPLLAIISFCFYVPEYFSFYFAKKAIVSSIYNELEMARALGILGVVRDIFRIILLPIGVCTYANIYIKKLHDQFDLYFKQP